MRNLILFLLSVLLLAYTPIANAQIQKESIWAPHHITIDGDLSEWNNNQVYNSINRIFYAVSNDDDNLYLILRAPGPFAIEKVMYGGVTFTVSPATEKKEREKSANNISIKFPVMQGAHVMSLSAGAQSYHMGLKHDTVANKKQIDVLLTGMNKELNSAAKEIQVTGIKTIADPTVSIYNTWGIKAMAGFNKNGAYTYELAIPLKYLNLPVSDVTKFSYNLKLNGANITHILADGTTSTGVQASANFDQNAAYFESPTDFWGEYTLAKKP